MEHPIGLYCLQLQMPMYEGAARSSCNVSSQGEGCCRKTAGGGNGSTTTDGSSTGCGAVAEVFVFATIQYYLMLVQLD